MAKAQSGRGGTRRSNKTVPYEQGGGGPWSIAGSAAEWSRGPKGYKSKVKKAAKVMGAEGPKRSTPRKATTKKKSGR